MTAGAILILAVCVHYGFERIAEALEEANEIRQEANEISLAANKLEMHYSKD